MPIFTPIFIYIEMIFVTGSTGLIGAHLLFELVKSGKKVVALKRGSSNIQQTLKIFSYYSTQPKNLFDKINWVDGDMLDYFRMQELIAGVDTVYHCAAIVSFDPRERKKMVSENVEGTANLVNASIENKVRKFCHVSSIAALGRTSNGVSITEETKWVPSKKNSGYSESKFFSETEVWRGIEEGIDAVIVNPSIVLGPGNWNQGSPKLFKAVYNGLNYYTKGITGYVYVKDVVQAMLTLTDDQHFPMCKNQRFLLNAENWSYQDMFNAIADALAVKKPGKYLSDFMLEVAWRVASVGRLFTNKPPFITKDAVSNSNAKHYFNGSKVKASIQGFEYRGISEIIKGIAEIFLAEAKNKGLK